MKIFTILAFLSAFLIAACTYTQKVKDGQFAYERKQYAVAISFLKKEYKKAKTRKEKSGKAFLLGESYKMTNQLDEAIQWYKTAYDNLYGIDALKEYAYALKANEEYQEAMQAFKDLGIEIGSPYEYRREIAACKVAKGWTSEISRAYTIQLADFNSRNADYSPVLYEDNQLVFTSDRNAASGEETYNWTGNDFSDLFVVDLQTQIVQPFDNHINTDLNEGTAVFNKSFTEVFFTRCLGDKQENFYCKIMRSKKTGNSWTTPVVLNFVEEDVNYGHPAISADDNTLYFASNSKDGWGGYDIWFSQRTPEGWDEPQLLSRSVNTIGNEKFPFLDGDTLYFSSDFHTGMGGLDIFKTYRRKNGAWTPVKNLKAPVNSGGDDFGFVVDYNAPKEKDVLQFGYFSSTRSEGMGGDDIYHFEKRIPPPEPEKPKEEIVYKMILEGYVLEKIFEEPDNPDSKYLGRKPLRNAIVKVAFGKQKKEFSVGENGLFTFELEENADYHFLAARQGYLNNETTFSTFGIGKDPENPVQVFEVEIILEKVFLNKEIVLEDIYYDFDQWDIRKDARPTLDALERTLELNPNIRIQLASHTDCRGNDRYNQDLSQKRAQSAVDYLISKGIDPNRLEAKGFGEGMLQVNCVCSRCTEEEHQENRRTTFAILDNL